jgi:D-alanyl-D-alanine carboxypeptidase (penicillin-binding protein 5/6)
VRRAPELRPARSRSVLARAAAAVLAVLAVLGAGAAPAQAQRGCPRIAAPAYILVEPATGDIVCQRARTQRRQIASTTKLMTALVTLERASLDDVMTTVGYGGLSVESLAGFGAGEKVTVRDLLRALLVTSANDAAATLAVRVAGSQPAFVRLMNRRARQLGLRNTRFANPIGLDDRDNFSSAEDLAKLALILRRNAFFRETVDQPSVTLRSGARPRTFPNRNALVRSTPFVNGVKTGHTSSAGFLLVGSGTRDGVTVVSVVMGDASESARDRDTLELLRHGIEGYRVRTVLREGQVLARARLEHRDETVELVAARTLRRTTRRDERVTVRVVEAPDQLDGPLAQGARVGTISVRMRGREIDRVALVTREAVDAATTMQKLATFLSRGSTLALLAAFALCSLYLVALRRRAVQRQRTGDEAEASVA